MKKTLYPTSRQGAIMIVTLVFMGIFLVMGGGLLSALLLQIRLSQIKEAQAIALHIAEAGANYYRWHLAHEGDDFADGTGQTNCNPCGPYNHDYEGIGQFSLEITPPPTGSTVVKIKSTGWINEYPNVKREIVVQYGIPSLARYSFLTNSNAWFGPQESIVGPMHGNRGVRQDGTNNSSVTSALSSYSCTSESGCSQSNCSGSCQWIGYCECPGVWGDGSIDELWKYPVPTINYDSLTTDLNQLKTNAENGGLCIGDGGPNCNLGGNSNIGFHIIFLPNGTLDLYRISSLRSPIKQLNDEWTEFINKAEQIQNETFVGNYAVPGNGLIYVEGDLWLEGTINGTMTVAAARLPGNPNSYKNIYINNNLMYLARDANHRLGLIAQKNIWVPKHAPTDLTIDAVMIAQNGRVARNLYSPALIKNKIEVYGGIITNLQWTWTWVDSNLNTVDGYDTTLSIYDPDLTYSPPPSFPTTGQYEFIQWEEILPGESY